MRPDREESKVDCGIAQRWVRLEYCHQDQLTEENKTWTLPEKKENEERM